MSINIQELINFKVNGLNELLTETQKHQLLEYQNQLKLLQVDLANIQSEINLVQTSTPTKSFSTVNNKTFTRKLLAVDVDYTLSQKAIIFLHGKSNYKLWFLNKGNKLCLVCGTKICGDSLYLNVVIDTKGTKSETKMSLDRFLYLIEVGDFKVTNKKFIQHYLKPYSESRHVKGMLEHLIAEKAQLERSISSIVNSDFYKNILEIYNQKEAKVLKEYRNSTKNLTRDVQAEKAKKKKAKQEKAQAAVKNLWDSIVTDANKAYFVGWLCKHVDNIHIKVVKDGVSDKVISASYPDSVYGNKYREKANSSGWDASSGKIRFTNIETAPITTIEALSTAKHVSRSANGQAAVFKDRTLSNLDLCLFILGTYYKYGFKSGVRELNKSINYEALCAECFPDNIEDFKLGFNA